jgi:hypothetical protein
MNFIAIILLSVVRFLLPVMKTELPSFVFNKTYNMHSEAFFLWHLLFHLENDSLTLN